MFVFGENAFFLQKSSSPLLGIDQTNLKFTVMMTKEVFTKI